MLKFWPFLLLACMLFSWDAVSAGSALKSGKLLASDNDIRIFQIEPDRRGGKAYKLVYLIHAPIQVYWRYKTDFDNEFIESSPFIRQHCFLNQTGNEAVIENKYTNAPDLFFKWRTTLLPEALRLDFVLLNPREVRHKFHYGQIRLKAVANRTQVTQVAYFDFFGGSLWAAYPWGGGMTDFLLTTARWEQEMVMRLKHRYGWQPNEKGLD